jgi:hypothetical protein
MTRRISRPALCRAIDAVRNLSAIDKERLAGEIRRAQPHLFGAFLAQHPLGVSLEKMEFLLEILCICYRAMQESGLAWPLITDEAQERQLAAYLVVMKCDTGSDGTSGGGALKQYVAHHPERELLAFVFGELNNFLKRSNPEETDKYVMLAAITFVNCIAGVALPAANRDLHRTSGNPE